MQARGLKESLLQYLSTTYALVDEGAREALYRFLADDSSGMFRGPYLRIRTPFRPADESWRQHLEWQRPGFTPYLHQARAFARLTSAHGHTPEPTLVTTGTGSGKTEAFLYPVLDHCARANRETGHSGVKALFLYPMNALATDQAERIQGLLTINSELEGLRAGLYIGEKAGTTYTKVATRRSEMQVSPPDILITNYKMLDLLLQRPDDAAIWRDSQIRYVVVDEFHSYDGAQATDVAMLLRRLAAAVGASRPGAPLGSICPVATSATLASGTDNEGSARLLEVATDVFGTPFTSEAVIGEDRLGVEQFLVTPSFEERRDMLLPTPDEILALRPPKADPADEGLLDLIELVTGERDADPMRLGERLRRHRYTRALLLTLNGELKSTPEVLDLLGWNGAASWDETIAFRPERAGEALARFVALLSYARADADGRPFVSIEVHQWVRSISRVLRGVLASGKAEFRWDSAGQAAVAQGADRTAPLTTATSGQRANLFLPAVYCRDCGRSGWAVFSPESDNLAVQFDSVKIRRATASQDKARVRNLIAATDGEAREGSGAASMSRTGTGAGLLMILDGSKGRLRLPDPVRDYDQATGAPQLTDGDSTFVLVHLSDTADTAAREDWCPACTGRNAIRYLGTGSAALAAASITQLFTGGELDQNAGEDKTLMFSDSVQDAAHRAGFVADRSYTFSLRALLTDHLSTERPTALNDLVANVVEATTDPDTLAAVVPPDLHGLRGVDRLLSGAGRGGDLATWRLLGQRLAFDTLMEFGHRSRNGRTLELTRTAAAQVRIPDPGAVIAAARAAHEQAVEGKVPLVEHSDADYLALVRILLERVRTRGGITHAWLAKYLDEAGTSRYHIWGKRPEGMRAFPRGIAAPVFLLSAHKKDSEFDFAAGRLSWPERWAGRTLGIPRELAAVFWQQLLPALVGLGLLAVRTPKDSSLRVYGLLPGHIAVRLLADEEANTAFVRCPDCLWEQTVDPELLDQWHGAPCPGYRCRSGKLLAGDRGEESGRHRRDRDFTKDYYRRLYRDAGTYQVVTAEHTGLLTRPQREKVERAFKHRAGFKDPNVLSCTPTLEMGIDIGDLSAVILAALPRRAASYAQQAGRAGRHTGNAFLLTIPDRRRRDLYFLEQPKELIAGTITPPGCYLSAIEILRRQYLAHLLDLAAAGRLAREVQGERLPLRALPQKAGQLFGPSGYLEDLIATVLPPGEALAAGFLALLPTGVSEQSRQSLLAFARGGLRSRIEEAERGWYRGRQSLRDRLAAIAEAVTDLHDTDPEQARQKAELEAEQRSLGSRLASLDQEPAQSTLCDLGLLPNYALIDSTTVLSATLYGEDGVDPKTGKVKYRSKPEEYERPRRLALSEFAPGNTFYVNGYKHRVTGIEITNGGRQAWRTWRVCPACGHVRTENAAADRTPCPRCNGTRIQDDGCLFQVVEPAVVTSRARREDARIRDDRDEREQRSYTLTDAVDIDPATIEPGAWRHTTATFAVEYTRSAWIRRFNLGPLRYDTPARDAFAGQEVRLNPFHVCTGCGAATADGKPVFDEDSDAVEASTAAARNPELRHHRPWCPLRRGKSPRESGVSQEPVVLAHQLPTEALRVLLPAAVVDVDAKVHSFRAALHLGVDLHFGGEPQHLDTTLAVMPGPTPGETRRYLVLFDRLPGGTGYLDRLKEPAPFRETLAAAYRLISTCPCAAENRPACHRCLYRYTPDRFQDLVTRQQAMEMLEELLFAPGGGDGWATDAIATTADVGLEAQVDSELERRFLAVLRRWANVTKGVSMDEDGNLSAHLRLTNDEETVHWRLVGQKRLPGTVTDFTFSLVDGPRRVIHAYLEGYRYHASPEHNRIASDAAKRTAVRAGGEAIFQITWDDLDRFEDLPVTGEPAWPPYHGQAQDQARNAYEQYGGRRSDFGGAVFVNPLETLLGYLRDPDPQLWARRAQALVTGLTRHSGTRPVAQASSREELVAAIRRELSGHDEAGGAPAARTPIGPVHVFRSTDTAGLDLLVLLNAARPDRLRWSLIAVLDDRPAVFTDEAAHKRRWQAWLYWTNLTQFLPDSAAGGDAVQLAVSTGVEFDPEVLAACSDPVPDQATPLEQAVARLVRDAAWDEEILDLMREDPDEAPELLRLAEQLADRGKRAPVYGYELGSGRWPADFAWDYGDAKIAVVSARVGDDDPEAQRRDDAYLAAGWTVLTPAEWLAHIDELTDRLPDTDAPETPSADNLEGSLR
ncbi:RNA helicase [Streptomyces sp. XY431]|nr:RNA helicase [Streptomyces sp. XY431]